VTKLSDYTQVPDTIAETVTICGVSFKLSEFNMATRGLWLDELEAFGIPKLMEDIQYNVIPGVAALESTVSGDPKLRSLNDRMAALKRKHDRLLQRYGTDDEPEDIDARLDELADAIEVLNERINALAEPKTKAAVDQAMDAQQRISAFMRLQDQCRLSFAWKLARASDRFEGSFEDWLELAQTGDQDACERWVTRGNLGWEVRQDVNQMKNRAISQPRGATSIGTKSTSKPSPAESDPKSSAN
jgi:hypothetical protein